jgi:hypothetical protein
LAISIQRRVVYRAIGELGEHGVLRVELGTALNPSEGDLVGALSTRIANRALPAR